MLKKAELTKLAQECVESYNPYIARATVYEYDGKTLYAWNGVLHTAEDLNKAYMETAMKDIEAGYKQRMVGYYDKWYRYNHADEGHAYDIGVKRATAEPKCKDYMTIIECMA